MPTFRGLEGSSVAVPIRTGFGFTHKRNYLELMVSAIPLIFHLKIQVDTKIHHSVQPYISTLIRR